MLFNNNLEFSVTNVYKDVAGNYIFVKIMDTYVLIVSLYGPNRDDPEFYFDLEERISEVDIESIIIRCDWNLVLDFTLDHQL